MYISTMNDAPGFTVTQLIGEVSGLTVRSRNMFSNIGASFKALIGGELKGIAKNLAMSRQEAIERMVLEAGARGANAILAMRFDTSEYGGIIEVYVYGTAVVLENVHS